jgi:hypothetical protein
MWVNGLGASRPIGFGTGSLASLIDLGTLAGLLEQGHQLAAYCESCQRWRLVPLADLVAAGHGARQPLVRVRCRSCGGSGELQVRPPAPTLDPQCSGWMELR